MKQENTEKRGSNITKPKHRKVVNNFRGSSKIKHFIERIKDYRMLVNKNDKLSIEDLNCAKYFSEPFDKNSDRNV